MDVDNVETTYFDKCAFFAAFDSFLLQLCLIHLSFASLRQFLRCWVRILLLKSVGVWHNIVRIVGYSCSFCNLYNMTLTSNQLIVEIAGKILNGRPI